MHSRLVLIYSAVVFSIATGLQSDERSQPMVFHTFVALGKRLNLNIGNVDHPAYRWRRNGGPVSEKCEFTLAQNYSTLNCPDFDWSDEGRYEYHEINGDGQSELMLVVDVKVAESCSKRPAEKQAEQQPDELQSAAIDDECFCSGITDRCRKAENLFRSQIVVPLTEAHMVDLKIDDNSFQEIHNKDSKHVQTSTYYALSAEISGNLLTSYGGYFEFPNNDDGIDEDSPDIILKGREDTLVYNNRRELLSEEISTNKILMTEQNFRHSDEGLVTKQTFMAVLSKVKSFYVKCNQYRKSHPLQVKLDSADKKNHGLGLVNTVEECDCRQGYTGLSCEDCSKGYYRRYAIHPQGICVSLREKLEYLKGTLDFASRFNIYQDLE
ncbi:basement membrane proteoglycan-like [Wyeomyia smithii]|uniref:basement membrane proteoglycan-like n=1 Tax=Wyeomyia smithii TaxID=174621 RepID=UPI002467E1B3|nr:basement membrane proteoglycan-like [Wyeomyia smithii]